MDESKTTSFSLSSISYNIIKACAFGIAIPNILLISKQNSYLSIIIGYIIGFIQLLIILKLMDKYKNCNIIKINEIIYGKILGKIINIILSFFILFFIFITMCNLTYFISNYFLNKTPPYIISLAFLIPIIYVNIKGINTISKTSLIIFYINIITIIFIFITLIFKIDITNFLPNPNNIKNILNGCYYFIAYNVLPIYLISIMPKNKIKDEKNFRKNMILMYTISTIEIFIITCLIIGILGPKLSNIYMYPEYQVLKNISVFSILEWICPIFILIAIGINFVVESIKCTINIRKKKEKKVLIYISSILIAIISELLLKKYNLLLNILSILLYVFLLIIPLTTLIISYIKKDKIN